MFGRWNWGWRSGDGILAENACLPKVAVPWISWSRENGVLPALVGLLGPGIGDDLRCTSKIGSTSATLVIPASLEEETVSSSSSRRSSGSDSLASNANVHESRLLRLSAGVSCASLLMDPVCSLASQACDGLVVRVSGSSTRRLVCHLRSWEPARYGSGIPRRRHCLSGRRAFCCRNWRSR